MKKTPAPTKQLSPLARKIATHAKKMTVPPKQQQNPLQPSAPDPV